MQRNMLLVSLFQLLAVVSAANAETTFTLPDFSPPSQRAVGGLTFNGAAFSNGTVVTSGPPQPQYGTFFFNKSVNAPIGERSFAAFFHVVLDTSNCDLGNAPYCNQGAALVLQNSEDGPNFIRFNQPFAAAPAPNYTQHGPAGNAPSASAVVPGVGVVAGWGAYFGEDYTYSEDNLTDYNFDGYPSVVGGVSDVLTWVYYDDDTKNMTVGVSFDVNSTMPTINNSRIFDLYGIHGLNGGSTYFVGIGAASDFFGFLGNNTAAPQGATIVSMWFSTLTSKAAITSPTVTATATPSPTTNNAVHTIAFPSILLVTMISILLDRITSHI